MTAAVRARVRKSAKVLIEMASKEMDFRSEAQNTTAYRKALAKAYGDGLEGSTTGLLKVPYVFRDLCSEEVFVEELLKGETLCDLVRRTSEEQNINLADVQTW